MKCQETTERRQRKKAGDSPPLFLLLSSRSGLWLEVRESQRAVATVTRALPDLITTGGAHPTSRHPQMRTQIERKRNGGKGKHIMYLRAFLIHFNLNDLSPFPWGQWLMSVEVSKNARGGGCLNTHFWCLILNHQNIRTMNNK